MIRRVIGNLCLLAISILLTFLLFEGVLRIFFPIYSPIAKQQHENKDLMEFNEKYGWFHKKDLKTWIETQEYATEAYLNPKGGRGKEYEYRKPKRTKRIVVIGDSLSFGLGVNDNETFPVRLGELYEVAGENVEVINLGMNGFSTDQELLLLKDEAVKYSPDVVICQFYIGNDVAGNSSGVIYGKNKPYFSLEGKELKLNNYPSSKKVDEAAANQIVEEPKGRIAIPFVKEFLQKHSYAYIFFRLRYNNLLYKLGVRSSVSQQISTQGWEVTKALFLEMNEWCDDNDIEFLLLFVPTREQVIGAEDDYYQRDFIEFAKKNDIEYLDLLKIMPGRKDLNFAIDCHWNVKGNQFVAKSLFVKLEDMDID